MKLGLKDGDEPRISLAEEVRDYFIERVTEAEIARGEETTTWSEAGWMAVGLSLVGLICFALHFWAFGRADGTPPRSLFVTALSVVSLSFCSLTPGAKKWKVRLRMIAAVGSAMAIWGLFMRFVVQDAIAFSPAHIVLVLLVGVVSMAVMDLVEKRKARRLAK